MDIETQRLYWIYHDAKQRCTCDRHKLYNNYGGRGIKFLFDSFEDWLEYMGPRPEGFEMDRIDNDGNYEKGNMRWADRSTQQKNKRRYVTNTSGVRGVHYSKNKDRWVARCNVHKNGKRETLYAGKDFFEACCARLSWESNQSEVTFRNRRGEDIIRNEYTLGIRSVKGEVCNS